MRHLLFLLTVFLGFLHVAHAQVDSTVQGFSETFANATPELKSSGKLKELVDYNAEDSILFSLDGNEAFLYNKAVVDYEDINLKAGFISIDFERSELTARGVKDSTGAYTQRPVFTQEGKPYLADSMRYNFDSKKALIYGMVTNEGESYVHGERIKKDGDDDLFIKYAGFTTCNKPHPHYQFYTTKAKIEQGKRIYTGPALFEIGGVPTPVFVPFGFFPASQRRRSGIIVPTWGENRQQGFFLQNLGYYWAVNEKLDLTFLLDVYSYGGWAFTTAGRYDVRYRYNGNVNLKLKKTVLGDPLFNNSNNFTSQDFQLIWNHAQKATANPFSNFSASVDFVSPNFNRVNNGTTESYLTNTIKSTINYSLLFPGKPYKLNINASANQNLNTGYMTLRLPDVAFNVQRINPFKRRVSVGAKRWYEDIGLTYSGNFANSIEDTIGRIINPEGGLPQLTRQMKNGFRHAATINTNLRIWRFTLTPGVNATSRWYFSRQNYGLDTNGRIAIADSSSGFYQATNFNMNATLATKIYGQFNYRGYVKGIRHVMTPSVSYSLAPDFSDPQWGYYQQVFTTGSNGQDSLVGTGDRFAGYQYGNAGRGGQNALSLRLDNTLEAKVNAPGTKEGSRKVYLLRGLSASTSYNAAAEQFKWSTVNLNARTSLFQEKLSLLYNGVFDPYDVDSLGQRVGEQAFQTKNGVLRNTANTFQVGLRLRGKAKKRSEVQGEVKPAAEGGIQLAEDDLNFYQVKEFAAFAVPWALNIDFNLRQSIDPITGPRTTQSLAFVADVEITHNWRVNVSSGWDFEANDFTFTRFEIYRDLHCWQISVSWVPSPGFQQGYSFNIGIKSSMLQDVKYNRQRRFGDY